MSPSTVGWGLILIGLLGFASMAHCQPHDRLYRTSLAVAIGAQGLDIASSWGGIEANPRLFAGERFGWKATALKAGVVGSGLLVQYLILGRHPEARTVCTVVNFGMAGATAAVAVRNWRIK